MVNTTEEYWEVNGVSLQTLGWNITSWGGSRQAPPSLRGSDLTIPYRPGELFQGRRPSGRTITLEMWVTGADSDGIPAQGITSGANISTQALFNTQFKELRNLLWNQGKLVTLKKRWKNFGSDTLYTATAQAIYVGGLEPSLTGRSRANFSVDLYLPDPFFYGDPVSLTSTADGTLNIPEVLGDYETTNITIKINGGRNNMRVTNLSEGIYVNVAQNVPVGQHILLGVDDWTAIRKYDNGSSQSPALGAVTHFGHPYWMVLSPGSQNLKLTSSYGTGSMTLTYKPRYI